jgi:SAM-dependent methyltransferase
VRRGWINLDVMALPGVDVVHNLDEVPFPFADAAFDEIECQDVIEHLDLVPTMHELHRVLAPGGRLHIRSPHFTSFVFWADPTHRRAFSIATFGFFVPGQSSKRDYYFEFAFSAVERSAISFHKTPRQPWNRIVERLVNHSPTLQYYYEATFLARLFPALNIEVTLVR